jgi:hypothetical protein
VARSTVAVLRALLAAGAANRDAVRLGTKVPTLLPERIASTKVASKIQWINGYSAYATNV